MKLEHVAMSWLSDVVNHCCDLLPITVTVLGKLPRTNASDP